MVRRMVFTTSRSQLASASSFLYELYFSTDSIFSYGEIGYQIVFKTLSQMFPQDSVPSFPELNWAKLLEYVLLPEAVQILISQDLNLDNEEPARAVMLESADFGRTCHQDDDGYLIDEYMRD